jgi:hypothetical protein
MPRRNIILALITNVNTGLEFPRNGR